jgi:hypothetical protein
MNLRDHLIQAKALIAAPEEWGKGADRDCLCIADAVRVGDVQDDRDPRAKVAMVALERALPADFRADPHDWDHPVVQFNDAPETTHADVMALFDRAIAAA